MSWRLSRWRLPNIDEEPFLVFWNNQERQDITYLASYEWLKAFPTQHYVTEQMVLPKFKVIRSNPEADETLPNWVKRRGEPPALWQVSYRDLLKVVYTRKETRDPYPRPEEGIF